MTNDGLRKISNIEDIIFLPKNETFKKVKEVKKFGKKRLLKIAKNKQLNSKQILA